jgi:hypothetical protein
MRKIVGKRYRHRIVLVMLLLSITLPQKALVRCCVSLSSTITTPTATPGSHCPLKYAAQQQRASTEHHCPMLNHLDQQHQREWRCNCCPSQSSPSSSEISILRFLLPHLPTSKPTPSETNLFAANTVQLPTGTLTPPDPPPRPAVPVLR